MKRTILLGFVMSFCWTIPASAALTWYLDNAPIEQVTLKVGEIVKVRLYSDIPSYHQYDVTMGTGVPIIPDAVHGVGLKAIEPLFLAGDLAEVQPLVGAVNVILHCEWSDPAPVSHWGEHWEVTLKGLLLGDFSVHSDWGQDEGPDDILTVTVVPEPSTFVLLACCSLTLNMFVRKKPDRP